MRGVIKGVLAVLLAMMVLGFAVLLLVVQLPGPVAVGVFVLLVVALYALVWF